MKFMKVFLIVLILSLLIAVPVLAAPATQTDPADVTPDQFATLLLGLVGVGMSLAFKYVPKLKEWFDTVKYKGLLMLALIVGSGGAYLALACTPYAPELGIQLVCGEASVFVLIKAIFILATGNQLTYLYLPKTKKADPYINKKAE